jgi:hypothetical protein
MLNEIIETLKGPLMLVLLAFLLVFVPVPESWHLVFSCGCNLLYLGTAYAWAMIFEDNKIAFWFWFVVCLIPYVRLIAFAVLTVYVVGKAIWDAIQPVQTARN